MEETLFYNLKAIVDGTENKIEDVIKLPGLEVDMCTVQRPTN
jgi:hypothetical protein